MDELARAAWYGQPFPNTFYAKSGGGAWLFERGWNEQRNLAWPIGGPLLVLAVPALAGRQRRLAQALGLLVLLRVAFQLWSGGAQLGRFRFLVPIVPIAQVLAVAGVAGMIRAPRARMWTAGAVAALMLVPGWLAYPVAEELALVYGAGLQRAHLRFGGEVFDHTSPRAVLAMDDAGLAPFICDRTNVDMLGLNDRHMAHVPGRFGEKVDVPYVLGRRPDLLVLVSRVARPRAAVDFKLAQHAALFDDRRFRSDYGFSRSYEVYEGYHLIVYRRHRSTEAPAAFWSGEGAADPRE
jgi:hypothetical protein